MFPYFFSNQFFKVIYSDLSFVRPHKQFTFSFSFLETWVHLLIHCQKNRTFFSYPSPLLCFQCPNTSTTVVKNILLSIVKLMFSSMWTSCCWFLRPVETMIVTPEKWHIWATLSLLTNGLWPRKTNKQIPPPQLSCCQWNMACNNNVSLPTLCHIACEKDGSYAWSLLPWSAWFM